MGATNISNQVLIPTRPSKGDDRWTRLQRGAIADLVLEEQQAVEGKGLAGQRPDGGGSGELNSVGIPPRTTGNLAAVLFGKTAKGGQIAGYYWLSYMFFAGNALKKDKKKGVDLCSAPSSGAISRQGCTQL